MIDGIKLGLEHKKVSLTPTERLILAELLEQGWKDDEVRTLMLQWHNGDISFSGLTTFLKGV